MPEYTTAMKQLEDMNLKYITEGKVQEEFQRSIRNMQKHKILWMLLSRNTKKVN